MTGDTFAMSQEIIELQTRVAELSVALERVTEQRDNCEDAARSLHEELEASRNRIKTLGGQLDRLRLHLQQGIEL
jgi:FtsZ-binding cell division protein ZapB